MGLWPLGPPCWLAFGFILLSPVSGIWVLQPTAPAQLLAPRPTFPSVPCTTDMRTLQPMVCLQFLAPRSLYIHAHIHTQWTGSPALRERVRNLIRGRDRLPWSLREHGQTSALISKLFTSGQSLLSPYHSVFPQLFLPESAKFMLFPAFVSSFDAVPSIEVLICVSACHCALVFLWACGEGPFKGWLYSCNGHRSNQEDRCLGSSICHCLSVLLCGLWDELPSHSLTRLSLRHPQTNCSYADAYVRTIVLIYHHIQWGLDSVFSANTGVWCCLSCLLILSVIQLPIQKMQVLPASCVVPDSTIQISWMSYLLQYS